MTTDTVLELLQTIAVLIGVVFGLDQLRQIRRQREVQGAIELLRPLNTPQATALMVRVAGLDRGLSEARLRKALGEDFDDTLGVLGLFEGMGPLVQRGYIDLKLYRAFYRGPTVHCWEVFERFIQQRRAEGWPTLFEGVEWLAIQCRSEKEG